MIKQPINISTKVRLTRTLYVPHYNGIILTLYKGETLQILEVQEQDLDLRVRCGYGYGNADWWFSPSDLECAA